MNKKIEVGDNQYIINGKAYSDAEIIEEMVNWTNRGFIFRANDVLLPHEIAPLFGASALQRHEDLSIPTFIQKFGSVSLKYLLYNAFLGGYDAGIARGKNDSNEYLDKTIENIFNEPSQHSEPVIKNEEKVVNIEPDINIEPDEKDSVVEKAINTAKEFASKFAKDKETIDNPSEIDDDENIEYDRFHYDANGRLLISSNGYKLGTYEKFISTVIESRMNRYGMSVDDIYEKNGVPTYILAEAIMDVKDSDTVDEYQNEIKEIFHSYLESVHENLTKTNTTV